MLLYDTSWEDKRFLNTGGWKDKVLDWQFNGMPTVGSIFPSRGNRPNRICGGNLPSSQRSLARYFDSSCFVPAAAELTLENRGMTIALAVGASV